jgi:hypothetical protein
MADDKGRPNHIEDVLITYRAGPWFTWTTSKDKTYANLRLAPKVQDPANHHKLIDNPHSIPTEQELTDKLTELQAEYDAQDYARKRKAEYPTIEELVVALYDTDDKSAIETKRAEVKAKYPKP